MSTYSTIHGTVTLDMNARTSFAASPSWEWCNPDELDDGITSATDDQGTTTITFSGSTHRNLCRYLTVDLAAAQQHGDVHGTITDDCSDGCNTRTVTHYDGRSNLVGAVDCFHLPVSALPGIVHRMDIGSPATNGVALHLLIPEALLDTTEGAASRPAGIELHGEPTTDMCACDGWDDIDDEPRCANHGNASTLDPKDLNVVITDMTINGGTTR